MINGEWLMNNRCSLIINDFHHPLGAVVARFSAIQLLLQDCDFDAAWYNGRRGILEKSTLMSHTISINLPDSLGDFVARQSAERGIDAYFETILRQQQREEARDRLEAELIKGIESGLCEPITPKFWQEVREEAKRRNALKKGEQP